MEKADAEKLMKINERSGSVLSEADAVLRRIADEAERKSFLYPLGEMIADIWDKLQGPIVKKFPDLDPDNDTEWYQDVMNKRMNKITGSCNSKK
jgi:hypothetical protein